jgi:hypothetical protein
MTIKSSGNVGIGTLTPATKLTVAGEITSTTANGLRIVAGSYGVFMRFDGGNFHIMSTPVNDQYGNWNAFRPFVYNVISGIATLGGVLAVQHEGNVGIGTSTPGYKLDVNGTCYINNNLFFGTTNRQMINLWSTTHAIGVQGYTTYFRTAAALGEFQFYQGGVHSDGIGDAGGGTALMTIKSSGNVGIGTASPAFKLDVNGVANFKLRDGTWYQSADNRPRLLFMPNSRTYFGSMNGYEWRNSSDSSIGTLENNGNFSVPGEIISTGANNTIAQFRAVSGGYGMIFRNDGGAFYMLPTNLNDPYGGWAGGINWPFIYNFSDRRVFLNGNTVIKQNGFLGISITPSYPLHIASYETSGTYSYGYLNSTASIGTAGAIAGTAMAPVSIWADYRCVASEFNAKSDVRIKKDVTDVDDVSALNVLRNIQPKQYKYIDTVAKGSTRVWGFIAQQIESVMDYAVSTTADYIPNVYDHAQSYDGGTKLKLEGRESSCMYMGKLVKVYVDDANKFEETMVKSIIDRTTVLCDPPLKITGRVFVYGQKVDDFKTLNKDAIFTVGIAAIQELDRELQQLTARIEALEARL